MNPEHESMNAAWKPGRIPNLHLLGGWILYAFCAIPWLNAAPEKPGFPSPDLFSLWEQIYNEPGQVLKDVRARLATLKQGQDEEQIAILSAIGAEAASFAENNEAAILLGKDAETVASRLKLYWPWVHALSTLGIAYEFDGKFKEAEEYLLRGVALAEESQDSELLAYALNNLGYYYARNKSTNEAIQAVSRAFRTISQLPHNLLYHDILNNLAAIYTRNELIGKAEEGRKLLLQSVEYFKSRNMRYMIGNNYITLGLFYMNKSENAVAIKTFQEAIDFARAHHIDDLLPYYLANLGQLYTINEHYQQSLDTLREAIDLFKKTQNNSMLSTCLTRIAVVHVHLKQPHEALKALNERDALAIDKDTDSDNESILGVKITAYRQLGESKKELETYRLWSDVLRRLYDQKNIESTQQIAGLLELERKDAQNLLLEEKNRTNTLRLEQADRVSRILMGLLASFILLCGFMLFSLRQSRVIHQQRNRMQAVLNTIEEGILRFGKDFRVESEYSAHLLQILEVKDDIAGQDIFPLLLQDADISADGQATLRTALQNILDEGELSWSLNNGQLPTELQRRQRVLNLLWQPQFNGQGQIDKIMLVIRDVTSSKILEAEVQASRRNSAVMTHYLQEMLQANPRSLGHFMQELPQDLARLNALLRVPASVPVALRQLHTLKGNARSLGLMDLAESAHLLETSCLSPGPPQPDLLPLTRVAEQYIKLFQDIFGDKTPSSSSLMSIVDEICPTLIQQLAKGQVPFGSITVKDEVGLWPDHLLNSLRIVILHGLSNAADHGYIHPMQKALLKTPAHFRVEAKQRANGYTLSIRDQGLGIDWGRLKLIADEQRFQPKNNRPMTDLLFQDGISTASAVSLSSGRGVGLAAIQDACRELGGEVALLDNDEGQGTLLEIHIPLPAVAVAS